MKLKLIIGTVLLGTFFLVGNIAWKSKTPGIKNNADSTIINSADLKLRMEQRAILTTAAFNDKSLLHLYVEAVRAKVADNPQNDEAITFDEIATELPEYLGDFARAFKSSYNTLLGGTYFSSDKFRDLVAGEPSGHITLDEIHVYDEAFYKNDAAQIYFPYSEDFADVDYNTVNPTVAYHPLEEPESVNAFKVINEEGIIDSIMVDEAYIQKNVTFGINFNESGERVLPLDPPPPIYTCNFLTYNTYSDVLDDRYVITATMPKIKLIANFRTWIGGTNKFTMYQCFAKPNNMGINLSPALDPITADKRAVVNEYQVKRRRVSRSEWVDFGQIYNDDWRLIQYDNPMLIFSKQGLLASPNGNFTAKVGGGLKLVEIKNAAGVITGYQWVPSFDINANAEINVHIGNQWKYQGSDYISRRGLLANAVGDNFANGDATQAGEATPWAVRKINDVMLYYFKVRECHQ